MYFTYSYGYSSSTYPRNLMRYTVYIYIWYILPSNIMEMIQDKEADCDIFATLPDMTGLKNDSFTCQILSI